LGVYSNRIALTGDIFDTSIEGITSNNKVKMIVPIFMNRIQLQLISTGEKEQK